MPQTKFCQGVSDISDSYMAFLIDELGVIHNDRSEKAFEGVVDCLRELKERKKIIYILTNAIFRADECRSILKECGVPQTVYDDVISVGEMLYQGMLTQTEEPFKGLGKKVFIISKDDDRHMLDGLGLEFVDQPEEATFLLIMSADTDKKIEDYEPILRKAVQKRLKALCLNPDLKTLVGSQLVMGAGAIARRYQDFGGVVAHIGKPHKPIFQMCVRKLQKLDIYPGQTAVIGDSMDHDITGGSAMGMDTALVRTGMHAGHFKSVQTLADLDKSLNALCAVHGNVRPVYLFNRLNWGRALPDRKHKKRKIF